MSEKVYIAALAAEVDRRESTVRSWCRTGKLPRRLMPKRDSDTGWRYWTPAQVRAIKDWMVNERMIPGGGLANWTPSAEDEEVLLGKLRRKRAA